MVTEPPEELGSGTFPLNISGTPATQVGLELTFKISLYNNILQYQKKNLLYKQNSVLNSQLFKELLLI